MRFDLLDRVLELTPDRIVTIKAVSAAEEYLADHFPTFPVLPGVLMLEAMVQAARRLADAQRPHASTSPPLVLGQVRALKYGRFVRPGDTLRVEVSRHAVADDTWDFRGHVALVGDAPDAGAAASGRFSLRPARLEGKPVAQASRL